MICQPKGAIKPGLFQSFLFRIRINVRDNNPGKLQASLINILMAVHGPTLTIEVNRSKKLTYRNLRTHRIQRHKPTYRGDSADPAGCQE